MGEEIGILMPVKEPHPRFFLQAIRSVLRQTSSDWRLYIIGRGDTSDISSRLMDVHNERIVVFSQEGEYLAGALNTGMMRARNRFCCILLGDDMLVDKAVSVLQYNIDANPAVDFFHSSRHIVDSNGELLFSSKSIDFSSPKQFEEHGAAKHLLCWRREASLSIGGIDENVKFHGPDDYDFPWSMADAGFHFKAIPDFLYVYRDHYDGYRGTTHVPLHVQVDDLRYIFKKHGLSDVEAERQIAIRKKGYLKQALFP